VAVKQVLTAQDLTDLPEIPGKRFELVRGELIEMPVASALHSLIVRLLAKLLDAFAEEHGLGLVFGDGAGYTVSRDPDVVRVPDVSFIAADKLREHGSPRGVWPFAPDLAVEIVWPSERRDQVQTKILEYLGGGSRLVWVLWPERRSVSVHAADGTVRELGPEDELDGGEVLPTFRVHVADLFAPIP
jgi:Uma2 family endonuclease